MVWHLHGETLTLEVGDSWVGDRLYLSSSWGCILIASFILGVPSLLLEWLFVSPITRHQTKHCSWQHWEWAKLLGRASLCSVVKVVPLSAQVGCINKCGWLGKARQSLCRQRGCGFKERPSTESVQAERPWVYGISPSNPRFHTTSCCPWPLFECFAGTKHYHIISNCWLFFLFIPYQRTENKHLRPDTLKPTTVSNIALVPHPISCNILINRLYSWHAVTRKRTDLVSNHQGFKTFVTKFEQDLKQCFPNLELGTPQEHLCGIWFEKEHIEN